MATALPTCCAPCSAEKTCSCDVAPHPVLASCYNFLSFKVGNCTVRVCFSREAAATGDVTAVSVPTYCFHGHPTPSATPGPQLHPCPVIPGCGGVSVPRKTAASGRACRRGARGKPAAACRCRRCLPAPPPRPLPRAVPAPGAAGPGARRPEGGASRPSLARKMAAGRRGGGSPSGRRDAQRPGAGGPRPA